MAPPIRITLFSWMANVTRGGQINILRLIQGLPSDFVLDVVAPTDGPLLDAARGRGGRGIVQAMPRLGRAPRFGLAVNPLSWGRFSSLRRLLAEQQADVIYIDPVGFVPAISLARPRLRPPKLVWHAQVAFETNRDAFALRTVDAAISVSPSVDTRLARHAGHATRVRIPNAVDCALFSPGRDEALRREGNAGPADPVILCVGSIEREKGPLELLTAFGQLRTKVPNAKLWLVGDVCQDFQTHFERACAALGSDSLRHWGPRRDVARFYRAADIFAFPSHAEGMPLALLEAMASGLPCVGSDALGVKFLLENEIGIVVKAREALELEAALTRLCRDEELKKTLGSRARAHVEGRYGVAAYVSAFERLLRQLARPEPS